MNPRLFVALRPPAPVRSALLDCMHGVENARWQDDAQIHLTLAWCGETPVAIAEDLVLALAAIRFTPFEVVLRGTGDFAKRGRPHTLYAGIAPSQALENLQRKVERVCRRHGALPEERAFHPHVTLARLNATAGLLAPFHARVGERTLGRWMCESYALYESHLQPEGSLYEPVRVYRAE